jgi:lysophospholipase L1-like esterase
MHKLLVISLGMALISATFPRKKPRIWILGDSTASIWPASAYPQMGWAQVLQERLHPDSAEVQDKALAGRSSKSFLTDGSGWPAFKDLITAGDYMVIQFGHNDEKTDPALSTLPGSTFEQHLSIYIDFARKVGAIPILATSIQRNYWNSDGKTLSQSHVIAGRGDYPQAVRNLAASKNVALVDMTKLTNDYLEGIGKTAATRLFVDAAHPNETGAKAFAKLFTDNLVLQKIVLIATWVKGSTVSIAPGAALGRSGEAVFQGNGVVRIDCKERISAFSILNMKGEVENDRGRVGEGNILSLTSKSGNPLAPGKYILRYQVSGSASRSVSIETR